MWHATRDKEQVRVPRNDVVGNTAQQATTGRILGEIVIQYADRIKNI
jgi:hypothetical protein